MFLWICTAMAAAMPITDLSWRIVNDSVMGGISQSTVEVADSLDFSGVLSLERNGGFASMRARVPRQAFAEAEAITFIANGDGRTYDLTLRRSDVPLRAGSYRARIPTEKGETRVVVPLSAFRPTSFGRLVQGAPALDSDRSRIDTIGVMLADKQPGPFALEILEISVVPAGPRDDTPRMPMLRDLAGAIQQGVPLYNQGETAACRDLYASALGRALAGGSLTPGEQAIVTEAMKESSGRAASDAAWTLRYAMDTVLAGARS